jgi:hypothetical protein
LARIAADNAAWKPSWLVFPRERAPLR